MPHVNIALCPVRVMSCVHSRHNWRDFQEEGASLLDSHVLFPPVLCSSWRLTGLQASGVYPIRTFRDTLHISASSTSTLAGASLKGAPGIAFLESFTSVQWMTSQKVSAAPQWQLSRSSNSAWAGSFLMSLDQPPSGWFPACWSQSVKPQQNFCAMHCAISEPTLMKTKSQA